MCCQGPPIIIQDVQGQNRREKLSSPTCFANSHSNVPNPLGHLLQLQVLVLQQGPRTKSKNKRRSSSGPPAILPQALFIMFGKAHPQLCRACAQPTRISSWNTAAADFPPCMPKASGTDFRAMTKEINEYLVDPVTVVDVPLPDVGLVETARNKTLQKCSLVLLHTYAVYYNIANNREARPEESPSKRSANVGRPPGLHFPPSHTHAITSPASPNFWQNFRG